MDSDWFKVKSSFMTITYSKPCRLLNFSVLELNYHLQNGDSKAYFIVSIEIIKIIEVKCLEWYIAYSKDSEALVFIIECIICFYVL